MTKETPSLRKVSELEFVVEHTIRSTPERIFEAYTKRDLIAQWWAQPGQKLRVEEMDVRPGGKWRFAHILGEDKEMVMHGEYRDVDPVTHLSYTFNWGEGNDSEILAIVDLKAIDDGTRIRLTNRCTSREQRDAIVKYGAERGAKAAWERLDAFLSKKPVGTISNAVLFVSDQDEALEYYTKVLGLDIIAETPQPGGHRYIAVGVPGQSTCLVLWPGTPGQSADFNGNAPGHAAIAVADVEATFKEMQARGARIEQTTPVKAPFGTFFMALDPAGNRIQVYQPPGST